MPTVTTFDTTRRYIFLPIFVMTPSGRRREIAALLDTGAPATEFSDYALQYAGFLDAPQQTVQLQHGMQTQKYGRMTLPCVEICSHTLNNLSVFVSHFEKSWGIHALIGLDFFRQIKVTIDFQRGHLVTEPYAAA